MCRSLAQEWGEFGIRVNSISPGVSHIHVCSNGYTTKLTLVDTQYIRTPMTDQLLAEKPELEQKWMGGALLGRFGTPEDLKLPAVFLLSEGAAFMHGSDVRVDGGHCASA